jgi:predicted MPP superfamily phosphohydrolase
MKILHITDLHLDDFEGEKEFLRKGFYDEYIDRLFLAIEKKLTYNKIDYLIVTGDFINIGKIENYQFVETILIYLSEKFSIQKNNICLSIGNHDYKWKDLPVSNIDDEKKLKIPFKEFRDKFNSNHIVDSDNFYLTKLNENYYYLSIDSSWNSKNGAPGNFSTAEEDNLISVIKDNVNKDSHLLIGCHFPIISFDNNFLAGEETDWHENHIWIKGNSLRDRIKRIETRNTIWFHGDVHASHQKIIEHEIFVMTSKFGGKPDKSQQKRQAVLLSIDESENNISKITCSYEFPTHGQHPSLGDWSCSERQELRRFIPVNQTLKANNNELKPYNQEVENEILRLIKENGFYKFGRFHVSDEYISLGWVEINKLMTDKDLLNRIADKCYEIIKSEINLPNNNTLFLGIEIIGGKLASQLSVRFNVKNSIIPVRKKLNHYSEFEFSHSTAFELISSVHDVVIFIDLICSVKTIIEVLQEVY